VDEIMQLARNLKTDSVSRLQPTPPLKVQPTQTVAEAVTLMRRFQVGCLLVCERGALIGMFTERDLLRRVLGSELPMSTPISEVMTTDPVVVSTKEPIGSAIRRMQQGGYRHLPVIDESGQPTGILSVKRIIHYLVEHFPSTVYNLPPDPAAVPPTREGA